MTHYKLRYGTLFVYLYENRDCDTFEWRVGTILNQKGEGKNLHTRMLKRHSFGG